jgi:Ras-related protein Rab-1A
MIVYDVTNMESFLNVKSWLIELEQYFEIGKDVAFILVGNKSDMEF